MSMDTLEMTALGPRGNTRITVDDGLVSGLVAHLYLDGDSVQLTAAQARQLGEHLLARADDHGFRVGDVVKVQDGGYALVWDAEPDADGELGLSPLHGGTHYTTPDRLELAWRAPEPEPEGPADLKRL